VQRTAEAREQQPCAREHDPERGDQEPVLPVEAQRRNEMHDQRREGDVDDPPVQAVRQGRRGTYHARDDDAKCQTDNEQQQCRHERVSLAIVLSKVRAAFDLE
jgi:hypothetical protein